MGGGVAKQRNWAGWHPVTCGNLTAERSKGPKQLKKTWLIWNSSEAVVFPSCFPAFFLAPIHFLLWRKLRYGPGNDHSTRWGSHTRGVKLAPDATLASDFEKNEVPAKQRQNGAPCNFPIHFPLGNKPTLRARKRPLHPQWWLYPGGKIGARRNPKLRFRKKPTFFFILTCAFHSKKNYIFELKKWCFYPRWPWK